MKNSDIVSQPLLGSIKNVYIKYDFLQQKELLKIQQNLHEIADEDFRRTRYNYELSPQAVRAVDLDDLNKRICEIASYEYGINLVPYGSRGNIHAWKKGDYLDVHSDAEKEDCSSGIEKYQDFTWPPTPIQITALVYLNDDYEGGEIKFTWHGVTVTPSAGMLLLFPSTCLYPHEVIDVKEGIRYTYSVFLSNSSLVESFFKMFSLYKTQKNDRSI